VKRRENLCASQKRSYTAELRRLQHAGRFADHATALDALGAGFDPATYAINDGVDDLYVWPEYPRRHGCDVLTDTARFLGLTAAEDMIPAHLALTANFATS
jgi:hypothetical protein